MTRFTIPEYEDALRRVTGLDLTVSVYESPPPERVGIWSEDTELLQIDDLSTLQSLNRVLPRTLSRHSTFCKKRIDIIGLMDTAYGLEHALVVPVFRAKFRQALDSMVQPADPLATVRKVRERIEWIVWGASPLLLSQLEQAILD